MAFKSTPPFLCEFLIINHLLIFYFITYLLLIKKLINRMRCFIHKLGSNAQKTKLMTIMTGNFLNCLGASYY